MIKAFAAGHRLVVDERRIFAGSRVTIVAEKVHGLVIAEDDDDPAAGCRASAWSWRRLRTIFSEVRSAIGDVAKLNERLRPSGPMARPVATPAALAMSVHAWKSP